jgi:hypothetical protein
MWIEHIFTFTAEIQYDPQVKTNAFNSKEVNLTLKRDKCSIPTAISGKYPNSFFMGKYKCPDNPTSWTDQNCLPKWIKKGAKVLVQGRIDGRINEKKGEKVPGAYYMNFTEVIPMNGTPDAEVNKASARGEVFFAKHINNDTETMFLMKEAMKKSKPGDPLKFRYYRVLVNKQLNLDTFKIGSRPVFYGELGRDCLPVPPDVAAKIAADPKDPARYDLCFAPVIVASEYYI